MSSLSVHPFDNPLAAEVRGVDLSEHLPDATIAELRAAWMAHPVLVVRGQELSPERHLAFSRRFGDLQRHTVTELLHPKYPEIFVSSRRCL